MVVLLGILAGLLAVILALALLVCAFGWYRRRTRAAREAQQAAERERREAEAEARRRADAARAAHAKEVARKQAEWDRRSVAGTPFEIEQAKLKRDAERRAQLAREHEKTAREWDHD